MARQDVGLEVDVVADGERAEGRRGEGLGDERDLEPGLRLVGSLTALTVSETPSIAIEPLRVTSGLSSAGEPQAHDAPGARPR